MDHVAVVTGAGRGLGAAIARLLHDRGYRVLVADIDEAAAKETAVALDSSGNTAVAAVLDVRKKSDFESCATGSSTSGVGRTFSSTMPAVPRPAR